MGHAVRRRRWLVAAVAVLLGTAVAFPLGVIASHSFSDVPNSNTFHADIAAIKDAGVTSGCAPTLYCPSDFVTREQMAAFMNRLGALGPGKVPVVNAASAVEAQYAADADAVDGHDQVLPAEDIVIDVLHPWLVLATSQGFVIQHLADGTWVRRDDPGTALVLLPLQAPGQIGNVGYALESIELCFATSDDVTILGTAVAQASGSGSGAVPIAQDDTDRPMTADACFTVTDVDPEPTRGGVSVELELSFAAPSIARLGVVRTTWTPIEVSE